MFSKYTFIIFASVLFSAIVCFAGTQSQPSTKAGNTAQTQTGPAASDKEISVEDDEKKLSFECKGKNVNVGGDDNTITLTGKCASIVVDGDNNKITVDSVESITVTGDENKITWSGPKPRITDQGDDNVIKEKK